MVSDRATFAWVGDVFIVDSHRALGLGLWLMRCVVAHPDLQELRRWALVSTSARGLYARLGFTPLGDPERFMEIADPGVTSASAGAGGVTRAAASDRRWRFRPSVRNDAGGLYFAVP